MHPPIRPSLPVRPPSPLPTLAIIDAGCNSWLNQCVGLNNERHFLLFLVYFSVGCGCVSLWGWTPLLNTLDFANSVRATSPSPRADLDLVALPHPSIIHSNPLGSYVPHVCRCWSDGTLSGPVGD